jgi:hypothetical protein
MPIEQCNPNAVTMKFASLVASHRLGSRSAVCETEISNKCANCNRKHDHAVVSHEEKPIAKLVSLSSAFNKRGSSYMMKKL